MEGHQSIRTRQVDAGFAPRLEFMRDRMALRPREEALEGVNHDIADQIDSLLGSAFSEQVFHAAGLRDEKKIRQGIGENAIDLFRHGSVKAPQTCFHMGEGQAHLCGG